jgi:hypothetical protein
MTAISFKAFRGQVPRSSDRLLQPNYALSAANVKITSGALDPLKGIELVTNIGREVKTLFRYRHFIDGVPNDNWVTFEDDTDVVSSPLANDEEGRLYFTSAGHEPRMTTYEDAIDGPPYPSGWFVLGIPLPTVTPTVGVTGGSGSIETRGYVYTFVTALGEESGPSPAALESGFIDGTWNLSAMQVAPTNSGAVSAAASISGGLVRVTLDTVFGLAAHERLTLAAVDGMTDLNGSHRIVNVLPGTNQVDVALQTAQIYTSGGTWDREAPHNTTGMVKRIYRSAGTSGQFLFVAEIAVSATTYDDTIAGTLLGELIETSATLPPPGNLTCLISLPNGCLAGIAGNELCLSYPYRPGDWPMTNRYAFSGRGVALCPAGNSVIVLTDGFPILFSGTDPEAMSPTNMETYAPCVSKQGAVNVGGGALYPSFDGLWLVAPGAVTKVTSKLYREDEWKTLNPASFTSTYHDGQYYACYDTPQGPRIFVMDVNEPDGTTFVIDRADALLSNALDGELYIARDGRIYRWDADPENAYQGAWTSPNLQLGEPTNLAVAQVHARFADIVPPDTSMLARNHVVMAAGADAVGGHVLGFEFLDLEINGDTLLRPRITTEKKVQFTLIGDGQTIYTRNVDSSRPFKLPDRVKYETVGVSLSGSVRIYSSSIASSTAELKRVP